MKLFLLSCLLASSAFGQSHKPEKPKPDSWWLPRPAPDLEDRKPKIMPLIREGVAAYDAYQILKKKEERQKAVALDSKKADDEKAWQMLHEELVATQKEIEKLDQAIQMTADAYGIRPKGEGTIQNGDIMKGTKVAWQAKFFDQEKTIREVKDSRGYLRCIDVPSAGKNDRAITKDDGFTAVRIAAFRDAVAEGDPSSLAGTLYHEAVHYTRLVTRDSTHIGWKTKEEDFALAKKLKAATVLGLSQEQIAMTEEAREEYEGPVREIAAGRQKGTQLFLASVQESHNQDDFIELGKREQAIATETDKLRKRMLARDAVEGLRYWADQACRRPGRLGEGEADSLARDYAGARNAELGISPWSATAMPMDVCQTRMLGRILKRLDRGATGFNGAQFRGLALEVVREQEQEFKGAVGSLQALAQRACGSPGSLSWEDAASLESAFNTLHNGWGYFYTWPEQALLGLSGCPHDALDSFLLAKRRLMETCRETVCPGVLPDELNALARLAAERNDGTGMRRLLVGWYHEAGRNALIAVATKACRSPGSLTREDARNIQSAYAMLDECRKEVPGFTLPGSALQGTSGCVRELMSFMLRSQEQFGERPLGPWEELYNQTSAKVAEKYPPAERGPGGQGGEAQPAPDPGRARLPSEEDIRRRMDDIRRRMNR